MFCIKPLKPLLHNVVCLSHFDHIDIFTSEVIPNLFLGRGLKMIRLSEKVGRVTIQNHCYNHIISCFFFFFKLPLLLDCVDQHKEYHNSFKSYVNNQ